ncbi:uncharacterized protein LOC129614567 isoform X2 [Condylostylus longicornis]|uniref:uncharacterized protein LOC129614567 isoform X2 n=1 Tax=Condylostylus longicornis TaxID=2530218 RepID=UPI00244E0B4B|nr:uncharacterized protein LOC129614567 isoform X2 [Condylostylus longicornis]
MHLRVYECIQEKSQKSIFLFVAIELGHRFAESQNADFPDNSGGNLISTPAFSHQHWKEVGGKKMVQYNATNSLDGVPFNLSTMIHTNNFFESQQSKVDHILAAFTRLASVENAKGYDFALEKNVVDI